MALNGRVHSAKGQDIHMGFLEAGFSEISFRHTQFSETQRFLLIFRTSSTKPSYSKKGRNFW